MIIEKGRQITVDYFSVLIVSLMDFNTYLKFKLIFFYGVPDSVDLLKEILSGALNVLITRIMV